MAITSLDTDLDTLTLTLVADFDADADRVWELWADPRKLERWWGPPGFPAIFEQHDLSPGGKMVYYMTSPDGDKYYGWWRIETVDPPRSLKLTDGFGDAEGKPNPDLPATQTLVELSPDGGGTRMTMRSKFPSREGMQKMVEMGMVEGIGQAVGQMDALLG